MEFVYEQGGSNSKDKENRRIVRSQAMRDYRRRQREERESATVKNGLQGEGHYHQSVSPTTSQQSWPENTESHIVPPRNFLPLSPITSSRSYGRSSSAVPSTKPHNEFVFYDIGTQAIMNEPKDSDTSINRQHDPASERKTEHMLSVCHNYLHWVRPDIAPEIASKLFGLIWDLKLNPMLLTSFYLASVGHIDAAQTDFSTGKYEPEKESVLQHLSEQMGDRNTATSDMTMSILTCLLSFEMSQGSDESLRHLRGLKCFLGKRKDAPSMVKKLDLIHAVLYDNSPFLSKIGDIDTPASGEISYLDHTLFHELEHMQSRGDLSLYNAATLSDFAALLGASLECMRSVEEGEPNISAIVSLQKDTASFGLGNFDGSDDTAPTTAQILHEACFAVLCIHYHMITSRRAFRHSSNALYVTEIYNVFRTVDVAVWQDLRYLRLYILLVAAASTLDDDIKRYLTAELVRAIHQKEHEEREMVEYFILGFLARRGSSRLNLMTGEEEL